MNNEETALRIFVRTQIIEKNDYASAFALACRHFADMADFEQRFDHYWDHYEVRSL